MVTFGTGIGVAVADREAVYRRSGQHTRKRDIIFSNPPARIATADRENVGSVSPVARASPEWPPRASISRFDLSTPQELSASATTATKQLAGSKRRLRTTLDSDSGT
jgi:hypothetical protein